MPEKDPTTWTAATWLLALGMAFGGGVVNWYAKVKRGHTAQQAGMSVSIDDITRLLAAVDVSEQAAQEALDRLGLRLSAEPETI